MLKHNLLKHDQGHQNGSATFDHFFFFSSCFMSICNPEGYDRPEPLYVLYKNLAWLDVTYAYIPALSCRVYHTTFEDFNPPDSGVY